ncbi:hypothetical protein IPH19_02855 [Candidatus Uhrbacteria bacterium]|nr:MAG: hypothetical protein IPH19_02855 [Candidatus Uhrbacteria bacterium]
MQKRSSSQPERIDSIISRMTIGGRRIAPDSPQGPCSLCGHETTHATSIKVDEERAHFSCREKARASAISKLMLERDFLSVSEALGKEGVLFRRLEERLMPYINKPSGESLCRMITFCLKEIGNDPSIRAERKTYLRLWLEDIRGRYLPTTN